ncbi:MAG: tRNA (adenosine(37)-N6)-threonylcarbamoyltransferase complex dimerization subunit type 1 TsaB [Steroidobacteraceae bacterium]
MADRRNLLAIDTASAQAAVALHIGPDLLVRVLPAAQDQSRAVLPAVRELLAEAGLSRSSLGAIVLARGPGGFTGVRLGVAVAQGLAYGLDLPVVAVSNLAALAHCAFAAAPGAKRALACVDARMREVYFAVYERESILLQQPTAPERVGAPADMPLDLLAAGDVAAGSGLSQFPQSADALRLRGVVMPANLIQCDMADIIALGLAALERGEILAAAEAQPVYLREQVTAVTKQ